MEDSSSEVIRQTVLAFVQAQSLNEKRRLVHAQPAVLMSFDADEALAALIREYGEDPDTVRHLTQHRRLLARCREAGVETAFAEILSPEAAAEELQNVVSALTQSIRASRDIPTRIRLCLRGLQLADRQEHPKLWSWFCAEAGNSFARHPLGQRADNLEEAIRFYRLALEVRTRDAHPTDWASTLNNLANVFVNRIHGERAGNLEEAIDLYQLVLTVRTRDAFPSEWALTQNNLGNAYADRLRGERADNLDQAIYHYQLALEVHSRDAFPVYWAMIQDNLGNVLADRIHGDRADNLEQALQHYRLALEVRTRDTIPADWAATENNLGTVYAARVRGNRADNLEEAIARYQLALEVRTREDFPVEWAMTQNNLANSYSDRIRGERASNLDLAIDHFQRSLEVRTREALPVEWAMTQNNLAIAYSDRIRGERADNLEQAINLFTLALEVLTRDAFPSDWATTQNNLAGAYWSRVRGERANNLEEAIRHYLLALTVRTRDAFPSDWATTQTNLATAYWNRLHGDRASNLEEAIHYYELALEVRTRDAFPVDWALIQNNLANVYWDRLRGDRADNLEKAIRHYELALEVRTRDAFPIDWALTQNNLANVYGNRLHGGRADNLEKAIGHFQLALAVRTRDAFPAEHRQTQLGLGNLHFKEKQWAHALSAYRQAIEAGEDLLKSAYSDTGRQTEVGDAAHVYVLAAYCLAQINRFDDSFMVLERGKTRLLVEALALANLDLRAVPDETGSKLKGLRAEIRELEAELRLPAETPSRRSDRQLLDVLRQRRSNLNELVESLRQHNPDVMPRDVRLDDFLALVPLGGAVVAPIVTAHGTLVYVIPSGARAVTDAHLLRLDDFTVQDLNGLLWGSDEQPGWLQAYRQYAATRDSAAWKVAIAALSGQLWTEFVDPVNTRLRELNVSRALLLSSGGLQLLPLHAAWRAVDGHPRTLLDDFEITYAPSAYAWQVANQQVRDRTGEGAFVAGVNDYTRLPSLLHAVSEAGAIADLLGTTPLLDNLATKEAVVTQMARASTIHLSCHGGFNWESPLDSALYFCGDESLTLAEIIGHLDLKHARLVTLSACETGIIDVRHSPDEFLGLPAGFHQAGAPAVISSLWTVDDRSTALLMERFYRNHLEKGMPFPAALRAAQLWLRDATARELGDHYKSHIRMPADQAFEAHQELTTQWGQDDRPYESPYYWAAFQYNGA